MSIQLFKLSQNNDKQRIDVNFIQFSGGERHVQVSPEAIAQFSQGDVFLIRADLRSSNDIFDYLLLENVLLNLDFSVNVEVPYFPYARQDRTTTTGQAFSLEMMTHLINSNRVNTDKQNTLTVWDCHSQVTTDLLSKNTSFLNIENIESSMIIQQSDELMTLIHDENSVLICPDKGAISRTVDVASTLNMYDRNSEARIVYCDKQRDPSTGRILNAKINATDLTGKIAIITDDICDGGATFVGIAEGLKALNCEKVILYVTHGIFSKGLDVFNGLIDEIYTTDSFDQLRFNTNPMMNVINFKHNPMEKQP